MLVNISGTSNDNRYAVEIIKDKNVVNKDRFEYDVMSDGKIKFWTITFNDFNKLVDFLENLK